VFGPGIRVEQHAVRAVDAVAHQQRGLVFQARIAGVEIAPAPFARDREFFVILQHLQARAEHVTPRQVRQAGVRYRLLGRDPGGDLAVAARIGFQPAIGVGDLAAERGLDDVDAAGGGIDSGMHDGFPFS